LATDVTPTDDSPSAVPDGVRPLTYVGTPSTPATQPEIRQSSVETVNADASTPGVGQVG
jgi:hypothetical protein